MGKWKGLVVLMACLAAGAGTADEALVMQSAVPMDWWGSGETAVDVARDGVTAAVGYADGRVVLWNLSMRYRIASLQAGAHVMDGVRQLQWLDDGTRLLVTTAQQFSLFDTTTRTLMVQHPISVMWGESVEGDSAPLVDLAVNRDGTHIVFNDFTDAGLSRPDGQGGKEVVPLPDAAGARLALSPDGAWLAVMGYDEVRVLATDTLARRAAWPITSGERPFYPGGLRFSPDGAQLLVQTGVAGRPGAWLLEIDSGERQTLPNAREPRFMADGALIYFDDNSCLQRQRPGAAPEALPVTCRRDSRAAFAVTDEDVVFSAGRLVHAPSGAVLGELDAVPTQTRLVGVDEARGLLQVSLEPALSHPLFFAWPDRAIGPVPETGIQEWDLGTGERRPASGPTDHPDPWACFDADTHPDRLDASAQLSDGRLLLAAGNMVYQCQDGVITTRMQRSGPPVTWLRLRELPDEGPVLFLNDSQGDLELLAWPSGRSLGRTRIDPFADGSGLPSINTALELDFNDAGEVWMLTRYGLFVGDARQLYDGGVTASGYAPEQDRVALATEEGVRLYQPSTGALGEAVSVGDLQIRTLLFGRQRLYAQTSDAAVHVLDIEAPATLTLRASIYPVADRGSLILTPDGEYAASRDAVSQVTRREGMTLRAFTLFDGERNRPDRVLAALGHARPDYLAQLTHLVALREQRLAVRGARLDGDLLPTWSRTPPLVHDRRQLDVAVGGPDGARLHLFVANVRATPDDGVPVRGGEARHTLSLMPGENRITAHLALADGGRSDDLMAQVYSTVAAATRRTFLLGVGVSEYAQSQYDLRYAAKDIKDVAAHFVTLEGEHIETLLLTDKQATRSAILRAQRFLARAGLEDRVILYFAGHGVLADDGIYYFAPTDMDFETPGRRGVRFDEIEGLLAGTRARERLIFIDSCHAGENDDGAAGLLPAPTLLAGGDGEVSVRGLRRVGAIPDDAPEIDRPLLEDIFVELREGSGAHVIAASGAMEFALESARWNNGVFTAAVLEGLEAMAADLNGDRQIRVDELRRFVADRVAERTQGRQVPTVRGSNPALDFAVTRATLPEQETWTLGFGDDDADISQAQSIAFSGDGRTVVTLQKEELRRFDAEQGTLQAQVPLSLAQPRSLQVDATGRYALVLADDYELQRVDLQTGERVVLGGSDQGGHLARDPLVAAFSADGRRVLVEGGFPDLGVRVFDVDAGTAQTLPVSLPGFIRGLAIRGDGVRVADEYGMIVDLAPATGGEWAEQARWQLPQDDVQGFGRVSSWSEQGLQAQQMVLSADGRYLLRAFRHHTENVYDTNAGRHYIEAWDLDEKRRLMVREASALRGMAVTANGRGLLFDGDSYRVLHLPAGTEPEWLYRGDGQSYMPWALHPAGHTVLGPRWRDRVERWRIRR
ncbi:MAG: caspase family protein [Alcanivorax sp.]|nr:caspase family protein [Alcanivorax sp.]